MQNIKWLQLSLSGLTEKQFHHRGHGGHREKRMIVISAAGAINN